MSNDSKYTLGPIYIVNFFGTLGFSIVFPFLVFLNLEFGGDSFVFGMLIAVYSIFQIPGAGKSIPLMFLQNIQGKYNLAGKFVKCCNIYHRVFGQVYGLH